MNILEAVETVLDRRPEALYVSALGTVTAALRSVSNDGPHLYFGGAMGSAAAAGRAGRRRRDANERPDVVEHRRGAPREPACRRDGRRPLRDDRRPDDRDARRVRPAGCGTPGDTSG